MQIMNFSSANCKNCYKCIRTCVVKAIEVKNDQAQIIEDRCLACGQCLVVCPQNARNILSHVDEVQAKIESGAQVIATLAPAYRGFFEASDKMVTGLRKLGFSSVQETSIGAEMVSREYERLIQQRQAGELITSCCPSIMMMIERYYPELIPNILPVVSPMIAHGKVIKAQSPGAYVVFIGPCFSKSCESAAEGNKGIIDAVLTFDEMNQWFEKSHIDLSTLEDSQPDQCGTLRGNKYPLVGGIINGIRPVLDQENLEVIRVHTVENCKTILEEMKKGNIHNVCIELSACNESCLGGPGAIGGSGNPYLRLQALQRYVKKSQSLTSQSPAGQPEQSQGEIKEAAPYPEINLKREFKNKQQNENLPAEKELARILKKMGKYDLSDELNCSACGYNTCKDKAVAVYQDMSQVEMCLPHMRNKAERMSNKIFSHSPNAIIVVDSSLNIEEINPTGQQVFGVTNKEITGKQISKIIDDTDFKEAMVSKNSSFKIKVSYPEHNYIAYRNVIYLEKQNALLIIFVGITEEEKRKEKFTALKQDMVAVTQEIIDKHMRTVQEIASLLGETTGETKVAFTKLKKVLEEEGDA